MTELDPTALPASASTAMLEPHANGHATVEEDESTANIDSQQTATVDEVASAEAIVADEPSTSGDAAGLSGLEPALARRPVANKLVSGRYRSAGTGIQVELRVDVDGKRPTKRVSADYYSVSGATTSYFGSMRLDQASISVTPTLVTISGTATYTWAAGAPKVTIAIPRVPGLSPNAAATLRHFTTGGTAGAVYVCGFVSTYFRSVLLEQDYQQGVTPFGSYNTGALPSGGPARNLSMFSAYAEAGIGMVSTGLNNLIANTPANASWSDAELHSAMQANFSKWTDIPQWAFWLMHAYLHDLGPGLYGIMFDQQGKQRQGSAVFYNTIGGTTADKLRLQLYCAVHETGHGFNLLHSWQKSLATPPAPNRIDALSWMAYPWYYPNGPGGANNPAAFWSNFAFQFDDLELVHLRHAFRDNVIMGGNPFATGAGLGRDAGWSDVDEDGSGVRLTLSASRSVPYGVPVSVDVALHGTTEAGRYVPTTLGPRPGTIDVAIGRPGGQAAAFEPLVHHCRGEEQLALLRAGDEPIRDSAFVHYGHEGFVFDQPGRYTLRARYVLDGSTVLSNVVSILVQAPVSAADVEVAELVFGDEQGTLMSILGSDDPRLQNGNDALREIIERHPEHPVAAVAKIVIGTNAAREFKQIGPDGAVVVRRANPDEAKALLGDVLDLAAVSKKAAAAADPAAAVDAAVTAIDAAGTKAEIPASVDAFIRSRIREIAIEVPELS
jgi:hypothetical protein